MRLVDREQRDRHLLELRQEALVVESLGSDVEELEAAGAQACRDVAHLVRTEARVEPGCVDALPDERVDLILHQRDQRRGDDRDAVEQQRRQLIAKALPGARGEDGERRAAGKERLDDPLLPLPKGSEAEPGGEQLSCACLICFHMRQRSTAVGPHDSASASNARRSVGADLESPEEGQRRPAPTRPPAFSASNPGTGAIFTNPERPSHSEFIGEELG